MSILNLSNPLRLHLLAQAVKSFTRPVSCIEVGTWFGLGSTQIFLKYLPEGSNLILIDQWQPFSTDHSNPTLKELSFQERKVFSTNHSTSIHNKYGDVHDNVSCLGGDAYLSTVSIVDAYNEKYPGKIDISILKSDSLEALSTLSANSFDLLYLDGDHSYQKVKSEIIESIRLLKKDSHSLLCGDDLEWPISNLHTCLVKPIKDFVLAPTQGFHPGVYMAVQEVLQNVNMLHGFWWRSFSPNNWHET